VSVAPPDDVSRQFLMALETADRRGALRVVSEAIEGGVDPVAVLEDVVCAAQREVGRLWQAGQWSVAREHAATAISEAAVEMVALRTGSGVDGGAGHGHVVVACVNEEWHALPARVVAEVLALQGWRTTYLGASTPPEQLASYLHEVAPDAVALSCVLATGLPRARRMIEAVHAAGVRTLAGGPAFGSDGRVALRLGADGWASTARQAPAALANLPSARGQLPPLEHNGLDEYATLTVRREELVTAAYRRLESRFPPLRSYDSLQVARTYEDLGHILDFLAAALFADERALFDDFTAWLQDLLVVRGVHEYALAVGYEAIADVLPGTPSARRLLHEAAQRLPTA
jgi:methanogenic corrinoid protein MtbC1